MNLEKEIKINKILLILLITLSVGTIALRTSHAMFTKKETFNNVLRIITGNELPRSGAEDLIKKAGQGGLQGIDPATGTLCTNDCKEYRYTGATVKNYVKLRNIKPETVDNDEPEMQEELWRIIGLFTDEETNEKYMRIVRNELLPETMLPTNYIANGTTYNLKILGTCVFWNQQSSGTRSNDWSTAGLQYYLNSEKDDGSNKGYMSYLSVETKAMLEERTHYLGTFIYNGDTAVSGYQHERDVKSCAGGKGSILNSVNLPSLGCNVWYGNAATWPGKISLMYPSDYGFSADKQYWSTTQLNKGGYDVSAKDTSWMYTTMKDTKSESSWMLSPTSRNNKSVMYWITDGYASFSDVGTPYSNTCYGVRTVLNLKSKVKIVSGYGTKEEPYQLEA